MSSLHNIGWRSPLKNSPFFKHASSSVALKISMRQPGSCFFGSVCGRLQTESERRGKQSREFENGQARFLFPITCRIDVPRFSR
jgi:hypothetical protein